MGTTTPTAPALTAPVADVEQKVEDKAPDALKPEVAQIESEFNAAVTTAAEDAPYEEQKAADKEPAVDNLARDAAQVASGGSVGFTQIGNDTNAFVKTVKAGWKTTEFWVSTAVIVLSQIGVLDLPGHYGKTITTGAAAAAYVLSRGLAK